MNYFVPKYLYQHVVSSDVSLFSRASSSLMEAQQKAAMPSTSGIHIEFYTLSEIYDNCKNSYYTMIDILFSCLFLPVEYLKYLIHPMVSTTPHSICMNYFVPKYLYQHVVSSDVSLFPEHHIHLWKPNKKPGCYPLQVDILNFIL